jgi:hypothetical protein
MTARAPRPLPAPAVPPREASFARRCGWAAYAVFLVLLFEGGARAFLSVEPLRKRVLGMDDASQRLRFVHRPAARGLYYSFDDPHPVRGWALRPNLVDARVFKGKRLGSNSRGARGRREHLCPKPKGVFRILVFGDSFTFGEGVSDEETYAARLEERLPGAEVVNLGVHGYGHDQMLLYLKEVGAAYEPDVVVLGFVHDDMERNRLAFRDFAKPRFELRGGRLVLTAVPVPTPEAVLAAEPWRSKFKDLFTMLSARVRERVSLAARERNLLTTALLDEFQRTVEGMGSRPLLAYLPVWDELEAPPGARTAGEAFFIPYCAERRVAHVLLRKAFLAEHDGGTPLKATGHWGPAEHEIAARGLRDALVKEGLAPALAEGGAAPPRRAAPTAAGSG